MTAACNAFMFILVQCGVRLQLSCMWVHDFDYIRKKVWVVKHVELHRWSHSSVDLTCLLATLRELISMACPVQAVQLACLSGLLVWCITWCEGKQDGWLPADQHAGCMRWLYALIVCGRRLAPVQQLVGLIELLWAIIYCCDLNN